MSERRMLEYRVNESENAAVQRGLGKLAMNALFWCATMLICLLVWFVLDAVKLATGRISAAVVALLIVVAGAAWLRCPPVSRRP